MKAGRTVSEADIPPPVAVPASRPVPATIDPPSAVSSSVMSQHSLSEPRQAPPAPSSIEIPRPSVISGGSQAVTVAPVPKPRTSVQSPSQPAVTSGSGSASAMTAAKAAANVPPVHLYTGPASQHAADTGTQPCTLLLNKQINVNL